VEEERIKSAFEIAMERISSLPELTSEDIAAQKEKQYAPLGEAIAGKYLRCLIGDDEMIGELDKLGAEPGQIVRRSLASSFCRAMRMEGDPDEAERALKGINLIAPSKSSLVRKAGEDFHSIVDKFEREKRVKSVEFGVSAVQSMGKLGISGSAPQPNLNENGEWQQELKRMRQSYESELETIRTRLLRELQIA